MTASSGVEASAISVLKRAVELDSEGKFTESLICYQEGIQLLLNALKEVSDTAKKQQYKLRIEDYMSRAEKIKLHVKKEKEAGKYHEQLHIAANSVGYSYEHIFNRFLDDFLREVVVQDPYIRIHHQIQNFLRFCEMLVAAKCKVNRITLLTGKDEGNFGVQKSKLDEIASSLLSHGIELQVNYSDTLHDREIRFSNGWIVKIGRGLDYFKPCSKHSLGFFNMNLRKCHETTVDIFHIKHTKDR